MGDNGDDGEYYVKLVEDAWRDLEAGLKRTAKAYA